jgi:hypothetical protein
MCILLVLPVKIRQAWEICKILIHTSFFFVLPPLAKKHPFMTSIAGQRQTHGKQIYSSELPSGKSH